MAVNLEFKPNRDLLDSNFEGYKLSLNQLQTTNSEFDISVDRLLPSSDQYSFLHARLFGLQNHLTGENINDTEAVYFIDQSWKVQKAYLDPYSYKLSDIISVWEMPYTELRKTGCYNVSIRLLPVNLAVVSNGNGTLYVLNTGDRSSDVTWNVLYSDDSIGPDKSFIIADAIFKEKPTPELNILLYSIDQNAVSKRFYSSIHWITLTQENNTWGQTKLKQLSSFGDIQYLHLEQTCQALYVVSTKGCKFTLDSDKPIIEEETVIRNKIYTWSQTKDDITLKFPISENFTKLDCDISTNNSDILITCKDEVLLSGTLYSSIENSLTKLSIADNILEIYLQKGKKSLMWTEVVIGDTKGQFIVDSGLAEEIHTNLSHLCSETEMKPEMGTTFNSQGIEECDFGNDDCTVFERLCPETHKVSHKINMGSNEVLLEVQLRENSPPALGIRHDVDVILWQPSFLEDSFQFTHESTLLAFGYIQASKQNKKFCVSPSDTKYAAICESSRHLFIYRQKNAVTSGELKNRKTGQKIGSLAQQQVVNIPNEDLLGIYASNSNLYLLGDHFLMTIKM